MRSPGFLSQLQMQLERVPFETLEAVNRPGGLEISDMINYILHPKDHTVHEPDDVIDVSSIDVTKSCPMGQEVALCLTINDLNDLDKAKRILDDNVAMSWLIVPEQILEKTCKENFDQRIKILPRNETFGLTPDNQLANLFDGSPILLPCGSGDGLLAISSCDELSNFIARGGKRVVLVDVSSFNEKKIDISKLLKRHVLGQKAITCPVARSFDVGSLPFVGVLCNHNGIDQVVECHRLVSDRKFSQFTWQSSGVMIVEAELIDVNSMKWNWCRVKRAVMGQLVVQFERSMYDLTSIYQTQYVDAYAE